MNIYESGEDYLETILMLKERNGNVRSIDIAHEMNFKKPSVSYAMKQFRENGYIFVDEDGFIHLTESGEQIAKRVYERHRVLTQLLLFLGVSKENAKKDACKIEHDLSEETFDCIKGYLMKSGINIKL
jgi:Mn-dependent DtxR family transcriptional regulator